MVESDSPDADAFRDVVTVQRIAAVPSILRILRDLTGMELVAVARVTEHRWIACALLNDSPVALDIGGELPIETTVCSDVTRRASPVAVDDCLHDPVLRDHVFFRRYPFRSYIADPIVLASGECFGTLCAMGTQPASVSNDTFSMLFRHFAEQVAAEIDSAGRAAGMLKQLLQEKSGGARREEFIAVLGHDLRNPLSSIASSAHLLRLRHPDPVSAQIAGRIVTNVRRMADLIDDLFDLTRGRLGRGMTIDLHPIEDLAAALEDVVDEIRGTYPDRFIESTVRIGPPVVGDRTRLLQLVSNLVANAVTHGSESTPIAVDVENGEGRLRIRVRNEGVPIPVESIPGLFDAYSRPPGAAPRTSGLGLGLYICEQIARAHGGRMEVESSASEGTVFTATIPQPATPGAPVHGPD